ncbi:hypothetical protein [Selenomonas sp. AB3002]|uniref:hypothetical protein n=1 Tax=Selenomonas sp. AB3002 TaxID=1392502 RepID=UPI00163951F9
MPMAIGPAGNSWQAQQIPKHDDLQQKLIQDRSSYREEIAQLSSTDEDSNRGQINEDYQKLSRIESKLAQISSQDAYKKPQLPPPTDEEMNRRFGSAYSVEISSLQSSKTLTSATPELETHSHL